MKILITGASGFIGSTVADEALRRGMETWAAVRASSSRAHLGDERLHLIELDLNDRQRLAGQLSRHRQQQGAWDCVVHCAGVTKCRHPHEFERTNYGGTRNLVEALEELGMMPRQFIFLSSLSVYGPLHEEQPYRPISEHDTPRPNTAYGRSKLMAEEFITRRPGVPYVIFRPTGVYGPRERDYYLMAKSIARHVDFSVGYRPQVITFVYVQDLARAIFLAIEKGVTRRSYFVSDGAGYSSRAFSDLIQRELGVRGVLHIKAPLALLKIISVCAEKIAALRGTASTLNRDKYKIMKQRNWLCDIGPLVDELGYRPQYDLERGTRLTIAWYKRHNWL